MNRSSTMNFRRTALALCLAALTGPALADAATEQALMQRLDQLARELDAVKAELAAMKAIPVAAPAPAPLPPPAVAVPEQPATVLGSYGEINVNLPSRQSGDSQLDIRRFVLAMQHRFDPATKLVTELEVEHAVSSASDAGEVEVEQAYIEHRVNDTVALRGGLMLMPIGLLNETHEPTTYYGVERNFVETAIIPSTLREAGAQAVLTFGDGYTLQGGVVTGPDLAKWDYGSEAGPGEGAETPLGAIHQEAQLAKARDPSFFGALNWRGIPGLWVGGSAIGGNAVHGTANTPDASYLLWDVHARYSPGPFKLSALYTQGSFSNTAAFNLLNVGRPTPIPERFDGLLFEAGYRLWKRDAMRLEPFARWEQFTTGAHYADLGTSLTPERRPNARVTTAGASFFLTEGVVLKADYQWFERNDAANRLNLGLGWYF